MSHIIRKKSASTTYGPECICYDGTYFWGVAATGTSTTSIIRYSVNATTYAVTATRYTVSGANSLNSFDGVVADGTYLYAVIVSNGQRVLHIFDKSSTPVHVASYNIGGDYDYGCDIVLDTQGYIIIINGDSGTPSWNLNIYSFDGSNIAMVLENTYTLCITKGALWDGQAFIFNCNPYSGGAWQACTLRRVTFIGGTLSFTDTKAYGVANSSDAAGVCTDGQYYFAAQYRTIYAVDYAEGGFTAALASATIDEEISDVRCDGAYIYVLSSETSLQNLYVYTFDGTAFTRVSFCQGAYGSTALNRHRMVFSDKVIAVTSASGVEFFHLDVVAQFNANRLTGRAPLTVEFTAI